MIDPARHRFVFIGGLHRSGTTLLGRCLAAHPEVSGFADTGVPADEGQHLQDVYPTARTYGGPGRFGFAAEAHLTEDSPLVSEQSAESLLAAWAPHWDTARPVLVEKSPPNLIRFRFLQALFPEASFVAVVRAPDRGLARHAEVVEDLALVPRRALGRLPPPLRRRPPPAPAASGHPLRGPGRPARRHALGAVLVHRSGADPDPSGHPPRRERGVLRPLAEGRSGPARAASLPAARTAFRGRDRAVRLQPREPAELGRAAWLPTTRC